MASRVPFIVDLSRVTFEQLGELLREVTEDMDGRSDWPPPQDKECMAVAGLNLLNLQVSCKHVSIVFLPCVNVNACIHLDLSPLFAVYRLSAEAKL